MRFSLILFFFLSSCLRAEVLKHDVIARDEQYIAFNDVCEFMGHKHNLIIEHDSLTTLDCMGSKVNVFEYCLKKYGKEKKILRGYIQTKLKEVVCESGEQVTLSIGCDKRDQHFCKDPIKGCEELRKIYAYSLTLFHHSFIPKDVDDGLNCYYSLEKNEAKPNPKNP
ncbi:MAG: hypothetical protein COW00_13750 [Bdellovibrio sp. CG12_big_fil_rev_8_21_14_0_65_39_13]|nr:MAG: hypothetical protein COW78_07175 [Bdellovibrio sp. CG22_combo_CG10-13_8_21_14_all_39_27]PIQ58677.1 MAG: hypothetical protein COW00_13750 [Bdellovibrio sp. CG12_big_fil_rev_8_21_14_0_65_39_13]PIR33052.1 MAG: hypothetical protein COV37_18345 [Bdellovibrio sp. CG11_big_fil_rev_8_21_14_0_20_39_38]PJB53739.1 MAG: hypothetical protein CO099_05525 [Bdellovibrio sp. CG_4_9_14_3_um_filter_39_7]